jgi:methyl-accepting chemotaxis protein
MRLTLKVKLGATFFVVIALAAISMVIAIQNLNSMNEALDDAINRQTARIMLVDDLIASQLGIQMQLREHILSVEDADIQAAEERMLGHRESAAAWFEELYELSGVEGRRRLDVVRDAWSENIQINDRVLELSRINLNEQAIRHLRTQSWPAWLKLESALGDVATLIDENLAEAERFSHALYDTSRTLLLAMLIGSVVIATLGAVWIVLNITRAVNSALGFANAVAAGDLNASTHVKTNDEIKDLIDALNAMAAKLREVVGEVSGAVRNVASGSQEMAAASEQLSQGATEQAASAEEASSSMEQMTANIKQSADNAAQTESIARDAARDAEASGQAVAEAVNAMETIAEKILIVQEIARQTDLLALNAAVEAARAGEHGRGFAVVAAEVRKLAERSQAAAQEISGLSGSTVKAAQSAGEMLAKLVPDIRKSAELIAEISLASNEQNAGASQINVAIQQLDRVTQQNTSAAEEMSATAEELSSQAEQLQAAIAFFRLDAQPAHEASAVGSRQLVLPAASPTVAKATRSRRVEGTGRDKADGGFAFDLDDSQDEWDVEFRRGERA